ncbi:MAG: hypothetical protein AAGJ31_13475, partial [Verrucomicrobiota bacterium]
MRSALIFLLGFIALAGAVYLGMREMPKQAQRDAAKDRIEVPEGFDPNEFEPGMTPEEAAGEVETPTEAPPAPPQPEPTDTEESPWGPFKEEDFGGSDYETPV